MASSASAIGASYWKSLWNQALSVVTKNTTFGSFSTQESLFNDFQEANDARLASMMQNDDDDDNDDDDEEYDHNDSTLPQDSRGWKRWVVVFVHAMVDTTKSEESSHAKNRFQNLWAREGKAGRAKVEIMAWDVLKHMQDYHAVGGPVDPSTDRKTKRRRGEGAFEQHAHDVAAALLHYKTICHDIAKRRDIQIFVDNVEKTTSRKKSYRSSNVGRAARNASLKEDREELSTLKPNSDGDAPTKKRKSNDDHATVDPKKRKGSADQVKKIDSTKSRKVRHPKKSGSIGGYDRPQHSNPAMITPGQLGDRTSYGDFGSNTEAETSSAGPNSNFGYPSDVFSQPQPSMPSTRPFGTELSQPNYAFGYTKNGYRPGEMSVLPMVDDRPASPQGYGGLPPVQNGREVHRESRGNNWSPGEQNPVRSYEDFFANPETRSSLHDNEQTSGYPFEDRFETPEAQGSLQDRKFVSPSEDGDFYQSAEEHSAINSVALNGPGENEYPSPPQVNETNLAGTDAFEDYFLRKGVEIFGNQYGTNGDSAHYSFQNSYNDDTDDDQ